MRDEVKIAVVMVLASHVSCLASADEVPILSPVTSNTSHLSSLISHLSLTNHAGRVVSGTFGGVTNGTFIVNGRAYPLSILPKGEQLRVKALAGCDVRTAKEKRLHHARDMKLERVRLREADGEIDKATAERLRSEAMGMK